LLAPPLHQRIIIGVFYAPGVVSGTPRLAHLARCPSYGPCGIRACSL